MQTIALEHIYTPVAPNMRRVHIDGVHNVRDLGGIPVGVGRVVAPGLIYRGATLDNITERGCETLFVKLGVRRVVDLRCGWERERARDFSEYGAEVLHIPLFDKDIVGIEYTEPAAGTKVVGRDVACDPIHYYGSIPNLLTSLQLAKAVDRIFDCACKGDAVYVHCSGGKDRAGIVSLLVLASLGAGRDEILADYLATNESRDSRYDEMLERFLRLADGDEQRARELVESHRARPENLEAFYSAVEEIHGGMERLIKDVLRIDQQTRDRLRALCTI